MTAIFLLVVAGLILWAIIVELWEDVDDGINYDDVRAATEVDAPRIGRLIDARNAVHL